MRGELARIVRRKEELDKRKRTEKEKGKGEVKEKEEKILQ